MYRTSSVYDTGCSANCTLDCFSIGELFVFDMQRLIQYSRA